MLKMYQRKDLLIGILLSLFVIVSAILIVTFIPFVYSMNISSYQLNALTDLTDKQMIKSLSTICRYLMIITPEPLIVPYFTLTKETLIHFKDVKLIYTILQIFWIIDLGLLVYFIRNRVKEGSLQFLKVSVICSVIILVFFAIIGLSDFSSAFILMHQLLFRNNYWLIDPMVDPVINIFPEVFFNHCLIAILVIILSINALFMVIYSIKRHSMIK